MPLVFLWNNGFTGAKFGLPHALRMTPSGGSSAAQAGCTHGEICATLRREFGFGPPLVIV